VKSAALMKERGYINRRKSRHRLTPGTVKFAAFHVLSLVGSEGLSILEVAEKIQVYPHPSFSSKLTLACHCFLM
jgi:hypothetical protein